MLTAKRKDGTLFTIPEQLSPDVLSVMKGAQPYYCPCCDSELIMKAGTIKIPHFAHKRHATCTASSDSESPYHLLAKRKLFTWFISHGYHAELEAYFPDIKKRADILVTVGDKRYALEFQCSTISETLFIERTKAYQSVHITPLWILAAKQVKRVEGQEFKLSSFQWLFVTGTSSYPFLWTYCPEQNQLSAIKGMTPFSPSVTFAERTTAPLERLSPTQLIPQLTNRFSFITLWRYKRKSWCFHRVKTANLQDPLFRAFYANRFTVTSLPIEVGIPVKGMCFIKTAAIEWQSWLYLDVLAKRELGQVIQLRAFFQSFQKRKEMGYIKVRSLPLLSVHEQVNPVQEYVLFLLKAGYLMETTIGNYKLMKKIVKPCTMDENEKMENLFYREHKSIIETGNIAYHSKKPIGFANE